jgi:poly-gamma-glutamate capsule biosynthesis protein CapA/YwtB (metallophosphatase superfamily)
MTLIRNYKHMRNFAQIFLVSTLTIISFYYVSYLIKDFEKTKDFSENHVKVDTVVTVAIAFVGDLMCHSVQFNYAHVEDDSFDFNGVFSEVEEYLSSADFTIGNFETVLAGSENGYSGYPFFNAPDDFLSAIKSAGFDLLITANNHALDQGIKGVERTIEQMDNIGINHTGTFLSQRDRDSIRIYDVRGISFAVLPYSYSTNGVPIPKGKNYIINLIDNDLIRKDIRQARSEGAEIVIVFFHFGDEYKREPNSYQKDVVSNAINAGADIIIGSHPHVVQPFDYFKTNEATLDSGFIAYSLGNFISNQRWRYSDAGVMLKVEISKNIFTDSLYLSNISYVPTWVFKGSTQKGKEYIILPSTKSYTDSVYIILNKSDREKMQQAFEDTEYIITKYDVVRNLNLP